MPNAFNSGNEEKILTRQADRLQTPPGCRVFASRLMPQGSDGPKLSYDANYACANQLTGTLQDNVDAQLTKLGYQRLPDTSPNPDQVLRTYYQNSDTNVRYTIGSPELGQRSSLGKKILTEDAKRQEHAAGVDIIFTKR